MKQIFSFLCATLLLAASCDGVAQQQDSNPTPQRRDRMLPASDATNQVVEHTYYTLAYSEADEQALWVAYMLTRSRTRGDEPRTNFFSDDPAVESGSATYGDYKGSGYTRGHLMPAGDAKWDATAMEESFLMSNISPQLREFNDGIWNRLEGKMRHWANVYDTIYIVTGPVLGKGIGGEAENLKRVTIGKLNQVTVPEYFYKAIYCPKEQQAIGFLLRHEQSNRPLQQFVISIDELEHVTGLDFFPELEDSLEERIEANAEVRDWPW